MKKFYALLASLLLTFGVVGCDKKEEGVNKQLSDSNVETIAYQAVSSLSAIPETGLSVMSSSIDQNALKEQVVGLLEQSEVLLDAELSIKEETLDRDNFKSKYSIEHNGMTYIMYISSAITNEEKDDDEVEQEVKYHGVMVVEEKEFNFEIEKSKETELDEVEEEIELKLIIAPNSYVTVTQEFEEESNEVEETFVFELVINGVKIDSFEIKRSFELNGLELEIEKNGIEFDFRFYTENEESLVEVKMNGIYLLTLKKITTVEEGKTIVSYELVVPQV